MKTRPNRHSINYAGHLWLSARQVKINRMVLGFPLSWQGRLRRALGPRSTWADLDRWEAEVGRLMEADKGGLRLDASDAEICHQADLTARDMVARLRDVEWMNPARKSLRIGRRVAGMDVVRLGDRNVDPGQADFREALQALAVRDVLDQRGLADLWPGGLSSDPEKCGWRKPKQRAAWIKRAMCPKFWRRVYRKLHARTVEAVAIGIGLVRKTAGLYCSDEAVGRSRAQDARCAAVLESVVAVNDRGQDYTLAELAAKGVANQEIRRHELLTRIAGFELIAKDCGHIAYMVTVTCASRFHAAATRGDRVVDNPKWQAERLTPRDGQENLSHLWGLCRTAGRAQKRGGISKKWYGFRIAEPQHDGTPHWHLLLFMPPQVANPKRGPMRSAQVMRELFLEYFLDRDCPDEKGAAEYRVDFEEIDWAKGSAVGYVIKYISKNIDGHGVGLDLFGNDAITSSQRVRAWAKTWRIRQFQQIGGAPVGVWRELRRIHPDNVPATAPEPLRQAISAMNVAKVEPGVQSLAWAKYNRAQGGVATCRKAQRIQLIKEVTGARTRYGEAAPDKTVGVWVNGVELFRNHIHQMDPTHPPFQRPVRVEVESERAQWLMGGASKAAALAVASVVFERSRAAASTRIHVNNCTGVSMAPPPSDFAPRVRRLRKLGVFRVFEPSPGRSPGHQPEVAT